MGTLVGRVRAVGWAALLALLVAGFSSLVWGGLIIANVLIGPTIPWNVVVMAVVLVLLWQYVGGRWAPRGTSQARRAYLRARMVPWHVFGWSWLAGGLALIALVGLWIVLVELTKVGGNPTIPGVGASSPVVLVLALIMGSLVSSITEEFAFRGYAQVALERAFPGIVAVAISSFFFMLWHGPTQGFEWSKLLFYFLVGVVFGTTAFLTKSILPALPVHLTGDLIFFFLIWPQDATRRFVPRDGADIWFWLAVGGTIVFALLALVAFRQLARLVRAGAPAAQPTWQIAPE